MTSGTASSSPKYNFCVEISKLSMLFFHNSHTHQPPIQFLNHRRLERFKKILCISKVFGSRGGGIEILTMTGVQKCQIFANQEVEQLYIPVVHAN